MTTAMRMIQSEKGWSLENNGKPLVIDGVVEHEDRGALVEKIEKRGLFVWSSGEIHKTAEEGLSVKGKMARVEKLDAEEAAKTAKPKKPRSKTTSAPSKPSGDAPKRRGRPRLYSPEEAAERRKEQAREYSKNRTEEQRAAARERARKWREENPDKAKKAREASMAKRAERYANDPNYRENVNAYQRDYKRKARSEAKPA